MHLYLRLAHGLITDVMSSSNSKHLFAALNLDD